MNGVPSPHKRPVASEGIALLIEDCERTSAALSMRPTPFQLEQAVNFLVATVPAALRNLEEQYEDVRDKWITQDAEFEIERTAVAMRINELKEQLERIEAIAQNAVDQGFLHQDEWQKVLGELRA